MYCLLIFRITESINNFPSLVTQLTSLLIQALQFIYFGLSDTGLGVQSLALYIMSSTWDTKASVNLLLSQLKLNENKKSTSNVPTHNPHKFNITPTKHSNLHHDHINNINHNNSNT